MNIPRKRASVTAAVDRAKQAPPAAADAMDFSDFQVGERYKEPEPVETAVAIGKQAGFAQSDRPVQDAPQPRQAPPPEAAAPPRRGPRKASPLQVQLGVRTTPEAQARMWALMDRLDAPMGVVFERALLALEKELQE